HMSMRDKFRAETPLRCPLCDGALENTMIRDLGAPNAYRRWELHPGCCSERGGFQAGGIERRPRVIFAANKTFDAARRLIGTGREVYQFPTVWNDVPGDERVKPTDPLDARYWQPRPVS